MDWLEPPQVFSFDGNHSWKLWLKHFDFFCGCSRYQGYQGYQGEKIKSFIFLACMSQEKHMRLLPLHLVMN